MHNIKWLFLIAAAVLAVACDKPRQQPAPMAPVAKAPVVAPVVNTNSRAHASEFVATGKADPPCQDCQHGDTNDSGKPKGPQEPLNEKMLAEVIKIIDDSCKILEDGVDLLEKNAKQPADAKDAIDAYRKKNAQMIATTFEKVRDIKTQLTSMGYEQEMPEQVRSRYEDRMTKIQQRLEVMREIYVKYPSALETFGALFPRNQR